MDTFLSWQTLVFYLPVAFGALLAIGAALGMTGDGQGDSHVDGQGDSNVDGEGHVDSPLSPLALGRLPLVLRLMLLSFTFGGVGLVLGPLVRAVTPGPPAVGGLLAIGVAVAGGLALSGGAARLIERWMPLLESETIARADLVGATGRLVLPASEHSGVVHVRDPRGNLHQVTCRLQAGEAALPAGAEVLLVEYDPATSLFLAVKSPLSVAPSPS